jgi:hypothetical protein
MLRLIHMSCHDHHASMLVCALVQGDGAKGRAIKFAHVDSTL